MTLEDNLIYPLIILGAGTIISSVLVSKFTSKYQDRQKELEIERQNRHKELEIKTELATRIAKITAVAAIVTQGLVNEEKFEITREKYSEQGTDMISIDLLMETYFEKSKILSKQHEWYYAISAYFFIFFTVKQSKHFVSDDSIEDVKHFMKNDGEKIDWKCFQIYESSPDAKEIEKNDEKIHDAWKVINGNIISGATEMVQEINNSKIQSIWDTYE